MIFCFNSIDINEWTFENALFANNIRESAPCQDEISSKHLSDHNDHQPHKVDLLNIQFQTTAANHYNNFNTTFVGNQDDQTEINNNTLTYHNQQQHTMLNTIHDPFLFINMEFLDELNLKTESVNQLVEDKVKSESADEDLDYLFHSELKGTILAIGQLEDIYLSEELKKEPSQSSQSDTMSLQSEPLTFDIIDYVEGENNVSC